MTKKDKSIPKTIRNYWPNEVLGISIDIHKIDDEDSGETLYNPSIMLHFSIEEETNRTLESTILITHVWVDDMKIAAEIALDSMTSLFDCPVFSHGVIFDGNGESIGEFSLNELFGSDEDVQEIGYDLANMEMNKPVIH